MARDGIAGTMDSAWGLVAIILRGWGAVLGGSGGFGGRGISVPICDVSGAISSRAIGITIHNSLEGLRAGLRKGL
jgi:hypothetical protein